MYTRFYRVFPIKLPLLLSTSYFQEITKFLYFLFLPTAEEGCVLKFYVGSTSLNLELFWAKFYEKELRIMME